MNEPTPLHKMSRDQLKVMSLKDRIGEITSKYEDEIAEFRAEATQKFGAMDDLVKSQESQIESLQQQLKKYQDAENDVQVKEDKSKPTK